MKLSSKGLPDHEFCRDTFGFKVCTWDEVMNDGEHDRLRRLREIYERKMNRAKFASEAAYWLRKMLRVQARAELHGWCV